MSEIKHVIQAHSGTNVVCLYKDQDGTVRVSINPVIAFALMDDGSVFPVTFQGLNDEADLSVTLPVQIPTGQVVLGYDTIYENLDSWHKAKAGEVE